MDSYYYSSPSYTTYEASFSPGAILAIVLATLLISLAFYALTAYFLSLVFKKAGVEQWKAWVPVYNNYVTLQLGGQPGWWVFLMFIPFVNIAAAVFMYIAMYHIGSKLQKSGAFLLFAIFLPIVWLIILGLDSSKWDDSRGTARLDRPNDRPSEQPAPTAQTADKPAGDDTTTDA